MDIEKLEFQITLYVDGTLPPADRRFIDDRLLTDALARKMVSDYRQLNAQLRNLPTNYNLNWDRVAEHLSATLDSEMKPAVAGRIGFVRSRWSIAAAMVLAATAALVGRQALHAHQSEPVEVDPSVIVAVSGPQADVAEGAAVQEVKIGPSPSIANADWRYGEGVVGRGPAKVTILGALNPTVKHGPNRQ